MPLVNRELTTLEERYEFWISQEGPHSPRGKFYRFLLEKNYPDAPIKISPLETTNIGIRLLREISSQKIPK